MTLLRLTTSGFRNLKPAEIAFLPGLTAVVGPNGSGKTSLLEAVAVLGNLVSFRSNSPTDWIQLGSKCFELSGDIRRGEGLCQLKQRLPATPGGTRGLFVGQRRLTNAEYLTVFPVATFAGSDVQLLLGSPQGRRRFLDRLSFHLHPETLDITQRYRRVLQHRNSLLRNNGGDQELEAFEHQLAFLGARISLLRRKVVSKLQVLVESELELFPWSLSRPVLRYNAREGVEGADVEAAATSLLRALQRGRRRERSYGVTLAGPHRHDLEVTVHGNSARATLSAGQAKVLVVALKLAALEVVARARGEVPTVVFDDVDAELDGGVLVQLLGRLQRCPQVVVSSAHEEMLIPRLRASALSRMESGVVRKVGGERSGS